MEIIYVDDFLIVINKPSGLLTIRDGYNIALPTVKNFLENEFGRCWIVHRLDKETSGVLLVAREESVHCALNLDFQNRQIKKVYHAIVHGKPEQVNFTINLPLLKNGDRKHRTVVDMANGKEAVTKVHLLNTNNEISLLEISPISGYTHQIRAHLSSCGYPLLGDQLYGHNVSKNNKPLIFRTALHAYHICFYHPKIKKELEFTAEYPHDLKIIIDLIP